MVIHISGTIHSSAPDSNPKSVISVMMIIALFLHRCFAALRAQWGSIVTEKQRNRRQKDGFISAEQSNDRLGFKVGSIN